VELVRSSLGLTVACNDRRIAAPRRRAAMAGDEVAPVRPHLHHLGQWMRLSE